MELIREKFLKFQFSSKKHFETGSYLPETMNGDSDEPSSVNPPSSAANPLGSVKDSMLRAAAQPEDSGDKPQSPSLLEVFHAEETPLLRFAYVITKRRAVAEEIVQEVFMKLHAKWHEVEAPRAWLYRSVRNRAFNHLRDHKREVLALPPSEETMCEESNDMPETMLERVELVKALRAVIDTLDPPDRQLVQLKYFENLRYRDISEKTGLSISNVGYRLHFILKTLATKLRPLGIDEEL